MIFSCVVPFKRKKTKIPDLSLPPCSSTGYIHISACLVQPGRKCPARRSALSSRRCGKPAGTQEESCNLGGKSGSLNLFLLINIKNFITHLIFFSGCGCRNWCRQIFTNVLAVLRIRIQDGKIRIRDGKIRIRDGKIRIRDGKIRIRDWKSRIRNTAYLNRYFN